MKLHYDQTGDSAHVICDAPPHDGQHASAGVRYFHTNLHLLGANLLTAVLLAAVCYFLATLYPVGYVFFVAEDHWTEYATSASWLVASLLLLYGLCCSTHLRNPGTILFMLGAFLIAMEEISWGQRIFEIRTPDTLKAINRQGELTLHNIEMLGGLDGWVIPAILVFVGLPILIATCSSKARHMLKRLGVPVLPVAIWPLFLLCIFFSKIAYRSLPLPYSWEPLELALGLAMLMTALYTVRQASWRENAIPKQYWKDTFLCLAAVCFITTPLALLANNKPIPAQTFRLAVTTEFPRCRMYSQTLALMDYMDEYISSDEHHDQWLPARIFALGQTGQSDEAQKLFDQSMRVLLEDRENTDNLAKSLQVEAILQLSIGNDEQKAKLFEDAYRQAEIQMRLTADNDLRARLLVVQAIVQYACGDESAAKRLLAQFQDFGLSSFDENHLYREYRRAKHFIRTFQRGRRSL